MPERRWERCASEAFAWIAGPSPAEGLLREAESKSASARRRVKPGNDEGKNGRTNENVGGETPTDARRFCRGSGHGRASQRRGAHLSAFRRGSRPKESFIARDAASGQASWDAASLLSGCYPPLPVPVQRQHLALRS